MNLSENQIQQRHKTTKELLREAERHQGRLRLHAQTQLWGNEKSVALNDFLFWVKSILPAEKYKRFIQIVRAPFPTLEITDGIFKELSRIFEGANPFFSYEFTDTKLNEDFRDYLQNDLNDHEFFSTKGFEQLKTAINSVLIIDLPTEQEGERPEPFYYFVQVNDIIELKVEQDGCIEEIKFHISEDKIGLYDEEFYRVYDVKDGKEVLVIESEHGLDYCPASFFWDKNLKNENNILKKSPLTDALSKLDQFFMFSVFKEYADMYAPFPIITAVQQICNYDGCDNGVILEPKTTIENNVERIYNVKTKCPECSNKQDIGPGSFYEKPVPQRAGDPEIGTPVEIITPDTKGLEYIKNKLEEYEEDIEELCLGEDGGINNSQALNETQVFGSFESRKNVLINLKTSFEKIHKFANDTVARLRYGSDKFLNSRVFYGDEFFLKNIEQLTAEYETAKKNGEPDEEINSIYWQIIQTKYKGNPEKIERSWILLNLNPEPHKTVDQCQILTKAQAMTANDFVIKSRFDNFIMKFEREQANILIFGSNLSFGAKIQKMKDVLSQYANEELLANSKTTGGSQEAANNLRGLVGGVTGIIEINKAVAAGEMDTATAANILVSLYAFTPEEAASMVTSNKLPIPPQ